MEAAAKAPLTRTDAKQAAAEAHNRLTDARQKALGVGDEAARVQNQAISTPRTIALNIP